jgi:uncharacterized integral membrane protein (TIGR00698 family)
MAFTNINRAHTLKSLTFVILLSLLSIYIAQFNYLKSMAISPLIVGVILGMLIANVGISKKIPEQWQLGFTFASKNVLRFAIALYGFRLTFQDLTQIGWQGSLFAVFIVCSTFIIGSYIGIKWLKLDTDTTFLICAGSSICGAAAVLATEPVLNAKPYKAALAVTTVVFFGCIAMFLYPFLYHLGMYHFSDQQMGVYLGGTLHEVAHVVGAGKAISTEVANIAIIEKMFRVILLVPFLFILRWAIKTFNQQKHPNTNDRKISPPWFALFFLLVIAVNSSAIITQPFVSAINVFDTFLLTLAMTALGLNTQFTQFKAIGLKPFYLAALLFVWLMTAGYAVTFMLLN